jgi:uncharacterized membrane protein YoaK (UPF0700 family)
VRRRGDGGSSSATVRNEMLVALSLAAGCVDAVGYLGLGHVFVANMTGNTVLLGIAIGQWNGKAALRAGTALGGFICGVGLGAAITGPGKQDRIAWPPIVTVVLAIELLALAAFTGGWVYTGAEPDGAARFALISLASLAMGLQSTAVRRLGIPGVATTYITGTLTDLTEGAIIHLRAVISAAAPGRRREERTSPSARGLILPADVWLAYGTGAIIAGAIALRWPPGSIVPSVAVVAAVVLLAAARHRRLSRP